MSTPAAGSTDRRLAWVVFLVLLPSVLYAAVNHWLVITAPGPMEYRENAMLLNTDLLLHGRNPYALDNQPQFNNVYGPGFNLLVAPLAWVFGNGYLVHRGLAAACLIGCSGVIAWALRHRRVSWPLALTAAGLLYADLAIRTTDQLLLLAVPFSIMARPDAPALLLFLLSVLIPWRYRFSRGSMFAGAVLAILTLLTKPYFVIGFPLVCAFVFCFVDKRKGLLGGVLFLVGTALVIGLMHWIFPTYVRMVLMGNERTLSPSWRHMWLQLGYFSWTHVGTIILSLSAGVVWVVRLKRTAAAGVWFNRSWRRGLVPWPVDLFAFMLMGCLVPLLWKLAPHQGNSMTYFYQLLSPWVFLIAFRFVQRVRSRKPLLAAIGLEVVILLFSLPPQVRHHAEIWAGWEKLISQHQVVYAPPTLSWIAHQQGKQIYDGGLAEYFVSTFNPDAAGDDALRNRFIAYRQELDEHVQQEKFDLIIAPFLDEKLMPMFLRTSLLNAHYRQARVVPTPMDWSPYHRGLVMLPKSRSAAPTTRPLGR